MASPVLICYTVTAYVGDRSLYSYGVHDRYLGEDSAQIVT